MAANFVLEGLKKIGVLELIAEFAVALTYTVWTEKEGPLGEIGLLELIAEFAVVLTYAVLTEREGTLETIAIERAPKAEEGIAEGNEDVKDELDDEDAEIMKFVEAEVVVAALVQEVLIKSLVRMVLGPSSPKLDVPWLIITL